MQTGYLQEAAMTGDNVEEYYRNQYEVFYAEYEDEYQASHRGLGTDDRDIDEIFLDVMEKLQFETDDVVLDLGCGSGLIAKKIMPLVKKTCCFDGSVSAIEKLSASLPKGSPAECVVGNFTDPLPYPDATFSKILSYSVFHFLGSSDDFTRVMQELKRITKPGGMILLGDLDISGDLHSQVRDYFMKHWLSYSWTLIKQGKIRLAAKILYKWSIIPVIRNDAEQQAGKSPAVFRLRNLCLRIIKYLCKCICAVIIRLTERRDSMGEKKKIEKKREIVSKIGEIDKIPHFQYSCEVLSTIKNTLDMPYHISFQRPSLPYAEDRLDILIERQKA